MSYSPLFYEMTIKALATKFAKYRRERKRQRHADPAECQRLFPEEEALVAQYDMYCADCQEWGVAPLQPEDFFEDMLA
ncbi:hypothetical protein FRB90_011187 [Tulasnella sp. 427]|nr:hypothetical protein FRB90_011187 [Tulasnella sp. 427]